MTDEHCTEKDCMFFHEGDNCWYWKHRNGLCKMPRDFTKLTQPVWDKDFDKSGGTK
jgi:hypothetical protein